MTKKISYFSLFLTIFLFSSILAFNIKGYYYTCFPAMDFSIYQEAINKLASFTDLNPYILVRGINIFNDHFDPIIFLGIPFGYLSNFHPVGYLVFQLAWFLGVFIIAWRYHKNAPLEVIALIFMFIILCRGLLGGLVFPLHPVTWSMLPAFLLVFFIKKENAIGIIATSFTLCLFKEFYPYCIIMLSFYYLTIKKSKIFLPLFIYASAYLIFLLFFREKLIGPTVPYSKRILDPLMAAPISFILDKIVTLEYKEFALLLTPFCLPIILIFKNLSNAENQKDKKYWHHFSIPVFIFLTPLLGIHFLSNMIHNWNGVSFAAPLLGVIIFSQFPYQVIKNRTLTTITLLIFLLTGSRHYAKIVKLLYFDDSKTCKISSEKAIAIKNVREMVKKMPAEKKILSTTGFVPWIIRPNKKIYLAGEYSQKRQDFDYLIVERGNTGFISPYNSQDIEKIIRLCSSKPPLTKNKFIYMQSGPFSPECLQTLFFKWILKPSNY